MLFYIKHFSYSRGMDMSEFKDKVNELTNQMVQTDDGKWELPDDVAEGLDEQTMFAITSERRYRDTQSAYTRAQQKVKQQEAITQGLQDRLLASEVVLSKEQTFELNRLKKEDPEKWREKLNEYETASRASLTTELAEIKKNSSNKGELEIRKEQMEAWSASTGIALTDEIIKNDLPPRLMKELSDGKVTFEQFLDKAGNFLNSEKAILGADESTDNDTKNLSKVAGGKEPSSTAQAGDFEETYEHTIF